MGLEHAKNQMANANPSNLPAKTEGERKRVPLSVPMQKLEVPEIPGFWCRWFRGTPARLAQAERAGFQFVLPEEIQLNNVSLGGDAKKDGNSDLGSRVSIVEGSEVGMDGQAVRMYLMKQPIEFKKEDDAMLQERNDQIADSLAAAFTTGTVGQGAAGAPAEDSADRNARYVDKTRTKRPNIFQRKMAAR